MSAWQNDGTELGGRVIIGASVFAILALVVGLAIGAYVGRAAAPDLQTLADQVRLNAKALNAQLAPARARYDIAVPDGTIIKPTPYADAQERIVRVRKQLASQHASFEALAPGAYGRAVTAVDALAAKASTPVPAAEFDRAFVAAQAAIGVLAGQ
ncbi:MAG: hypothetical protein ACR2J9_11410 [Gaiellales bacterium]